MAHAEDIGEWPLPDALAARLTHLRLPAWSPLAQDWSKFTQLGELIVIAEEVDPALPADEVNAAVYTNPDTDIALTLQALARAPALKRLVIDCTDLDLTPEQREAGTKTFTEILTAARAENENPAPPQLELQCRPDHLWNGEIDRWLNEVDRPG